MMQKIINKTCGKPICEALIADNPLSRTLGLMFQKNAVPILFKFPYSGIWPIHSMFVFFPFDAVYIDSEKRAAEIFANVPQWQLLITPHSHSLYLLELPAGKSSGIKVGDFLEW